MNGIYDSHAPAYRRIADDLSRAIVAGEYRPGGELPSIKRLMEIYGVTSNRTVMDALRILRGQGLIDVPGPGRPTTVRVPPQRIRRDAATRYQHEKDMALRGGLPFDSHLARDAGLPEEHTTVRLVDEHVGVDPAIARILSTEHDREVIHRYTFLITAGGAARLAHHYYTEQLDERVRQSLPGNAVDPGRSIWPGGVFYQLARLGIEPDRVFETTTARLPLGDEAELLALPEGVPLLCIRKVTYDTEGVPREVADVLNPGDRTEALYTIQLDRWAYPPDTHDDSDTD